MGPRLLLEKQVKLFFSKIQSLLRKRLVELASDRNEETYKVAFFKQAKKENAKSINAQSDELLSWADCFDAADIDTRHLIVSRQIERADVSTGYKVHIKFKISPKQFFGQE